jgi:hypothetical protein
MKTIKIHSPIWKTRSIGIAEYKLIDPIVIEIDYKTKTGERLYPGKYTITREKALSYPVQLIGGQMRLRIIPIDDLTRMTAKRGKIPAGKLSTMPPEESIPELEDIPPFAQDDIMREVEGAENE